jgi:hypothetical protein
MTQVMTARGKEPRTGVVVDIQSQAVNGQQAAELLWWLLEAISNS